MIGVDVAASDRSDILGQTFARRGRDLVRRVMVRGIETEWTLAISGRTAGVLSTHWFKRRLRADPHGPRSVVPLRVVDVFSGAGGFGEGFSEAAAAAGLQARFEGAVDIDEVALKTHRRNLRTRRMIHADAAMCVDYSLRSVDGLTSFAYSPQLLHRDLIEIGSCDVVIGGPPCQGHSNLNNHTRRSDQRNALYYVVPAIAVALQAKLVIIENVTTVLKDQQNVVERTKSVLVNEGYDVCEAILRAEDYGVAQTRRRHFLIASKGTGLDVSALSALQVQPITALEAIEDLCGKTSGTEFDRPTILTSANAERVKYLFEHDAYDLPNHQRPDCHKDGHTYPSVYGRMRPDQPAQTITGGFLQPGQGRFIHPVEPRSLTPHEGARLQGFPDSFHFCAAGGNAPNRKEYARLIGDAVPPPLAFAVSLMGIASTI